MRKAIQTTMALGVLLLPIGATASLYAPGGSGGGLGTGGEAASAEEAWRDLAAERTTVTGAEIYSAEGRRDPFEPYEIPELEGAESLPALDELILVGILEGERGPLAVFHGGREEKGLFLAEGARLRDGTVREVSFERLTVVVRQPTGDPKKPWVDKELPLHP